MVDGWLSQIWVEVLRFRPHFLDTKSNPVSHILLDLFIGHFDSH